MNKINYLEMLPLSGITKYAKGQHADGVPFFGHPRAHPSEKNKLILVNDPLGPNPAVLEFLLDDVMFVEEIPSAVTETGEGIPMIKLWIRRGEVGIILEPFEVDDSAQFAGKVHTVKDRIVQHMSQAAK